MRVHQSPLPFNPDTGAGLCRTTVFKQQCRTGSFQQRLGNKQPESQATGARFGLAFGDIGFAYAQQNVGGVASPSSSITITTRVALWTTVTVTRLRA